MLLYLLKHTGDVTYHNV